MRQYRAIVLLSLLTLVAYPIGSSSALAQDEPPAWAAPPIRSAVSVRDGRSGESISFDALLEALAGAEVVFLGETHNDETTHRVELAVYEGLLERRANQVVLAMEMFERDVQSHLDDYIAGRADETTFLAHSRPWVNYRTAYRPLIEKARSAGRPVIASNFPRSLRMRMAMQGAEALKNLKPEESQQTPREFYPNTDAYWRRVDNAVRSHADMMRGGTDPESRLYSTQSLWDNSMGEACADALGKYPGHLVLHLNGGFHSAYWDGTVHQLKTRKPDAKIKTVSIVPTTNPAVEEVAGAPAADFVVFAEARATDLNEGTYSVYGQQEIKYRLHLPDKATPEHRVPLVIFLSDDGFSSTDGLDLWKERLGNEAAIAVLDAPYRETLEDFSVGGRWFWPDTFSSDIGGMVGAVEMTWAYVARHYPIDPSSVCVVGEGTGATVAAAVALLADRMDLKAVAVDPRQYAKLKDFPLPMPELYGDLKPPAKSLRVIGSQADGQWWGDELTQYTEAGVPSEMVMRAEDPWQTEFQEEVAIREGLGLPTVAQPAVAARQYILVDGTAPRARHWARLHAQWMIAAGGPPVAVVSQPPPDAQATPISTEIHPHTFSAADALPKCPGPFGGTTVLVLPPQVDAQQLKAWKTLEENDPLAKGSRFHRLRVATTSGPGSLRDVLATLQAENRKNILVVPAVFFADASWMRALRADVRDLENQMTLQWQPGLGGRRVALDAAPDASTDIPLKHTLSVALLPDTHQIRVRDRIELPASLCGEGTEFLLSDALAITTSNPTLEKLPEAKPGQARYRLKNVPAEGVLELTYDGTIDHGLSDQKEEYTRGFRETRGVVAAEGVYLDGDSAWVPQFDDRLIRFSVEVDVPDNWHVISQGNGTSRDDQGIAKWESAGLVEQVYLVGGPLVRFSDAAGAVEALVYLHEQDDALARKYLDATAGYLEMYRQLIGAYPYTKFALVENFWETGYGMPSFTLLGPQVIRFPFILTSSYPHEILHNWWGNSVFVDYERGNWCEGLTAYLADHLIQEQRGLGAGYRQSTLQKYRNYVREGRDFPLTEFRSRHSAATEAVGYGKALMMDHMLRRKIGDDAFRSGLASFYRKFRGQRAGFDDLQSEYATITQTDLGPFFAQWTERKGAPSLAVDNVSTRKVDSGFAVSGILKQTQVEEPYELDVPVTILTISGPQTSVVTCNAREQEFTVEVSDTPLALHVDPMFDLFRLLDPRETPSSIGQIFGEPKIVAVLPSSAGEDRQGQYRQLMTAWISDSHSIDVVMDSELKALPEDRNVWILGRENRYAASLLADAAGNQHAATSDSVRLGDQDVAFANHSIVIVRRNPQNIEKAVGLLIVEPAAAFAGMARKLPHYGKYSYLAFEGDEPTNMAKGQWSADGSPLVVDLRTDRAGDLPELAPEKRAALAELPPVFSSRSLMEHVRWLSDPAREGRGLGSQGLQQSAEYIAQQMADIGLQPGGDNGTWFQRFTVAKGPDGRPVETMNVIGILPGKRTEWSQQSIVLSAHYDHLGNGWPDVREAFRGQLHPGADDNASGVAVMLELARNLAAEGGGSRNLICIAFSAEECGRLGSQHYVANPRFPAAGIRGAVNLDTVGRLFDGKLAVHAAGTADEWQHIFRGSGFVTGIPNQIVPEGGEASDQMSFIEKGIPAVQIFTGAHGDYHRPGDTLEKIDAAGLVKVAMFVKEALVYLLEREEPLTVRIGGAATAHASAPTAPGGGRRVMFGTVPVFDYPGPGVKIDSLVPDSPAAQSGLQPGDVIVRIDQQDIGDLRAFSEQLKKLEPGQAVTVELTRDGVKTTVKVTVVQR